MFSSSIPVTADGFFDRARERAVLRQAAQRLAAGAPGWLCLVGPRKVGKSSLLLEVARALRNEAKAQVHALVLDVQDTAPLSLEVFRDLALRAADAVLSPQAGVSLAQLARDPREWRKGLLATKAFDALPPGSRSFLLELPELELTQRDFVKSCLEVPEALAHATKGWLVVAIDEFQELAALSGPPEKDGLFAVMRATWQRHTRTGYVISGSARQMLTELVTSKASPFFQHFTVVEIGPFTERDAVELLVGLGKDVGGIGRSLAQAAYRAVGGSPFYLQVLGEALASLAGEPDEATRLKLGLQQVLFHRTGRLALYFEREWLRLVGRATTLAATLDALADGPARLTDVAARIKAPSGATLGYLERLGEAVQRTSDGRHELSDATFGLWLKWRRPGGSVVPMRLWGDEGEKACAEHFAGLGFDLVYQSRGSRGAFDLLALRGPVQLAVQVKRKAMPLRFSAREWHRMEAEALRYGWRWVVAAVDEAGGTKVLDPRKARKAKGAVLGDASIIENLLAWADRPPR